MACRSRRETVQAGDLLAVLLDCDDLLVGFCGVRTLALTLRQSEYIAGPKKNQRSKVEAVCHVSSVPIDEGHGVEYFADAVRGQWAIESKYYARRDWAYCEDVRARRCNENVTEASFPPGAVIARKIEKEESGARLRMR